MEPGCFSRPGVLRLNDNEMLFCASRRSLRWPREREPETGVLFSLILLVPRTSEGGHPGPRASKYPGPPLVVFGGPVASDEPTKGNKMNGRCLLSLFTFSPLSLLTFLFLTASLYNVLDPPSWYWQVWGISQAIYF